MLFDSGAGGKAKGRKWNMIKKLHSITQTWQSMSIAAIIYIRAESGKSMSIQVPNVMKQAIFLTCCQVNGHVSFPKSPHKEKT